MLKILNTIIANQLNPIDVMAKLDEILRNVNPNAPKVTYTFEGVKRIDSPGIANVGTEGVEAFQEIARLQRAKDWKGLIQISETQMKERPEWLTPYITAGQGYLILGQTDKAKNLLEYADKRIAGNPNYEGAQPLLRKLLSLVHKIPATQD